MKLYLARHGDYVMDAIQRLDVLTEKGFDDITRLALRLKQVNLSVGSILHSEKNRAKQTAELLAQGVMSAQPPKIYPGLKPDDDVSVIANEIIHWDEDSLIVGHLPFLGRLVSQLVTGTESKEIIFFETGTIVCLSPITQTHWAIHWVLNPQLA